MNALIQDYGKDRLKWPLKEGWTYYIYNGLSSSVMVSSVSVTPSTDGGGVKIAANVMANFGLDSIKINIGGGYPAVDLTYDSSLPGTTFTGFINWNSLNQGHSYPTDSGFYENASVDVTYRDPFSSTPNKVIAKSFRKFPSFIYLVKPGTYSFKESCSLADQECYLGCPNQEFANWTIASDPGGTGPADYRCGLPSKSENLSEGWPRGTQCDSSAPNGRRSQCEIYCREPATVWNNYKQDDDLYWIFRPTTTFSACGAQPQPARTVDCGSEMLPKTKGYILSDNSLALCQPNCPGAITDSSGRYITSGKYWNGSMCVACGDQEQSFGGAQTSCHAFCAKNNKIVNGRCIPCTGGQLSEGGNAMECECPLGAELQSGQCVCKSSIANLPAGASACVCPPTKDGFKRSLDSFGQCNCDNRATAEGGDCKVCSGGMFFNGQECLSALSCKNYQSPLIRGGNNVSARRPLEYVKDPAGVKYDDCCYQAGVDAKFYCKNSANNRLGTEHIYGTHCTDVDFFNYQKCNCVGGEKEGWPGDIGYKCNRTP